MTRPFDVDRLADAPLRYVLACQPLHERLRDAATQLGGMALMVMLRRDGGVDRAALLHDLTDGIDAASEALAAIPVPAAAAHHAHHMIEATAALRRVARLLAPGVPEEAMRARISIALRSATDHLRFAAGALPGFGMVDLTQSCCAAHAAALPAEATHELRF